jgi:hypothetical protein
MTYAEWSAEAGTFSRALRGLADRWDTALTAGVSRMDFEALRDEVGDVALEMEQALAEYPAGAA